MCTGRLDATASRLKDRTALLRNALAKLAADQERPTNALWARTSVLLMEFQEAVADPPRLDSVFREFREILLAADGLIAYPIDVVAKIVRELGAFLTDNAEYDALLEDVIVVTQRRVSESEAGRVLLQRGLQKLRKGNFYDAIRLFGRAQQKLALRECREELVTALLACGVAYQSVGLPWAARANVLGAANQALSDFVEHGEIVPQALSCVRNLVWCELTLGRVPYVLQWIEMAGAIAQNMALSGKREEDFLEERGEQDRLFGLLLLRAEFLDLEKLEFLPAILERLGLNYSWMALLYALGYEKRLRSEKVIPESETHDSVRDFFEQWVKIPAAQHFPDRPELLYGNRIVLHSRVLGCDVTASVSNDLGCLCLAETILAALEALLATSLERKVFPHAQRFDICLEVDTTAKGHAEYEFGESHVVRVRQNPNAKKSLKDGTRWLQDLVLDIMGRIVVVDGLEDYARRVFGDEAGLSRAVNFADPLIPLTNVLGKALRFRLADWESAMKGERFRLLRTVPWDHGLDMTKHRRGDEQETVQFGEGEPPPSLLDFSGVKHTDRQVVSLIDKMVWDRAGWRGVVYLVPEESNEPPLLALAFSDAGAARTIFTDWRTTLGKVDERDELRISIITGVDKQQPFSYRVVVGTDPNVLKGVSGRHFVMISRVHQMHPTNSENLDRFMKRFSAEKKYYLFPAHFPEGAASPEVFFDLGIGKRVVRVRPAWQIGLNDPDTVALQSGDDPIVPEGVPHAPVLAALDRVRRGRG